MAELLATMPAMPLRPSMRVQFEAIDPGTGVAVGGVVVSSAILYAKDTGGDGGVGALPDATPDWVWADDAANPSGFDDLGSPGPGV